MARPPDGNRTREFMVTARMSAEDRSMLDNGRKERGDRSNSDYLRRLVREDNAKIARRRPKGHG